MGIARESYKMSILYAMIKELWRLLKPEVQCSLKDGQPWMDYYVPDRAECRRCKCSTLCQHAEEFEHIQKTQG